MLARILGIALCAELAAYVLLGWVLVRVASVSGATAVLVALSIALGARAAFILATFAWAWLRRSPRAPQQRIGPLAALRLAGGEIGAFLVLYLFAQPFERRVMGPDHLFPVRTGTVPVLLVHGYFCNRGSWWRLRARLERAGHCVASVNLEPLFGSIDGGVERLRTRIEQVCERTGAQRVAILGHSMGGLVARGYLARYGAVRLACLITLGSPHRGSELAAAGLGRNAQQMHPGSAWLAAMASCPLPEGLPVTAIYSVHDNFVVPQAAQRLDGAENVALKGVGHLQLLFSREVSQKVLERLPPAAA